MENEDCFAYKKTGGRAKCFALTKKVCENCRFYKEKKQWIKEYEESYKNNSKVVETGLMAKNLYLELNMKG